MVNSPNNQIQIFDFQKIYRTPAAEMGAVCGAAWVTVLASAVSATAVRFAAVAELMVPEASVAGAAADSALAGLAGAAAAACA